MEESLHPEEARLWRTQVVVEAVDDGHAQINLPAWQGPSSFGVPLPVLPKRWRRAGMRGFAHANLGCARVEDLRIAMWDDAPNRGLAVEPRL